MVRGEISSEIIALFLQRNIFEEQKGLCYGGKLGKGGGWQGCRVGAGHFPLPALICQLSCRQDEAGGLSWLPGVMRVLLLSCSKGMQSTAGIEGQSG